MNLLYITKLTGNLWAGPSVCVPEIIKSQAQYDNVFWLNLNYVRKEEWLNFGGKFANLDDFPSGRLTDLPGVFSHPDLAVVEEVYAFPFCKIIDDIRVKGIPYIVVPHSQLTEMAQKKKAAKKKIGNLLWFNKMIKNAAAIQYLSQGEKRDSEKQWKTRGYIVPNGTESQKVTREIFHADGCIRASYIGRLDLYQKGLDYLIKAVGGLAGSLRKAGFQLNLYGPGNEEAQKELENLIRDHCVQDMVSVQGAVFNEEKRKVLLNTDVFVMCSRFEGHSMGMIEALSYGVPCLATEGTYMVEEITEYGAGWCGESNVEGVKKALSQMIAEVELFSQKGKGAKKLADIYSWDKIAEKNHDIYVRIWKGESQGNVFE